MSHFVSFLKKYSAQVASFLKSPNYDSSLAGLVGERFWLRLVSSSEFDPFFGTFSITLKGLLSCVVTIFLFLKERFQHTFSRIFLFLNSSPSKNSFRLILASVNAFLSKFNPLLGHSVDNSSSPCDFTSSLII